MRQSLLVGLLLFLAGNMADLSSQSATAASSQGQVGFYLRHFGGRVDPTSLPRVYGVFERMRSVADKDARRWPELVVVQGLPGARVLALPDGNLVLSRKAVDLMYRDVSPEQGDTRMAFVLGHELAHLSEDDFWDQEMALALAGSGEGERLTRQLGLAARHHQVRAKETRADDLGFLYAALAGYPVQTLLDEGRGRDFLSYWVGETGSGDDPEHAPPAARAKVLALRLEQRLEQVGLFDFGVRLAHFGRCGDALLFFQAFKDHFPSRELFNNIGYCRLQQAFETMAPDLARSYWLPRVLDGDSRLAAAPGGLDDPNKLRGRDHDPLTARFLRQAVTAFETAIDKDPFYLPGHINLAAARFLQGEVFKARAAVEDARRLRPDDAELRMLRALILYEENLELDLWPTVQAELSKLLEETGGSPMVRYNLAQLLEQRGRTGQSEPHWRQLGAELQLLPPHLRSLVCRRAAVDCGYGERPESRLAWRPVLPIGTDLLADGQAMRKLDGWQRVSFDWPGETRVSGHVYQSNEQSLLDLDGVVEMAVLRGAKMADIVVDFNGARVRRMAGGEVYSRDGWAVWVRDGKRRELWVVGEGG